VVVHDLDSLTPSALNSDAAVGGRL